MFELIAMMLGLNTTWVTDVNTWGARVLLYRQYAEGNHRANLSDNMRQMLRITGDTEYNINYCNTIVQTMVNRLVVAGIDAEASTEWVKAMLDWNSFDVLQMDIHEAVVRDGDAYLMVGFDEDGQYPKLSVELAWDGTVGVVPIYDPSNTNIIAAVKIWWASRETVNEEGVSSIVPMRRCNLYLPNAIRRYWWDGGEFISEDEWRVGYVPLVHYRNNTRTNTWQGISEIAPALGLQDSLNSVLVSMTMASELSAFGINVAFGFKSPSTVAPGAWIQVGNEDNNGNVLPIPNDQLVDVKQLSASPLVQYIDQAHFIIDQMAMITSTPLAKMGSDNVSGESLKQREVGLLAKVKKAQTRFAEAWVWAVELAFKVSAEYSKSNIAPSNPVKLMVKWQNAEVRNDAEVIKNVLAVQNVFGEDEALRLLAPVFGLDEATVQRIIDNKQQKTLNLLNGINGFGANGRIAN